MTEFTSGMFIEILKVLEGDLNFTTGIFKRFDDQWGAYNAETREWSGMVNGTVEGQADMIAACLTYTIDRAKFIKFLPPLADEVYSIVIKDPGAEDLSWVTYLNQFFPEIWLGILATAVIMAVVMWISHEFMTKGRIHVS